VARGIDREFKALANDASGPGPNPARAASCLQVLAHPYRLLILESLRDGEKSVGELELVCDCSQSGVSQHLRIMRDRGILEARKEANKVYYRLADPRIVGIIDAVKEIFCPRDGDRAGERTGGR
jgi:ArsR family transcriptional regulator